MNIKSISLHNSQISILIITLLADVFVICHLTNFTSYNDSVVIAATALYSSHVISGIVLKEKLKVALFKKIITTHNLKALHKINLILVHILHHAMFVLVMTV